MKLLKRFAAVMLSLVTCAQIGTWSQPMATEAIGTIPEDGTRILEYSVYDAQTGLQLENRTYNLIPPTSQNLTRSVIGNDTRSVDFTKTGVVKLIYPNDEGDQVNGTGFIVDDHTIATAAHCIHARPITQVLLFNSDGTVALSATPVESHIPSEFFESGRPYSDYNDYALLTVEEDLSSFPKFDLGVTLDTAITNQVSVSITGFPNIVLGNEANTPTDHIMYTGTGVLQDSNDSSACSVYRLKYSADTTDGNSGSPVYITSTYNGTTYYTALAIHTMPGNSGVRINRDLLYFYLNNPNIQY